MIKENWNIKKSIWTWKKNYPRPGSFMIVSFLQTSTELFTPLSANKSNKKDAGEKKLEKNRIGNQKGIRNFFSAKSKPDLHLEETNVIEIVENRLARSLVLCYYLCFLILTWKVTPKYLFSGNSLYQGVPYFLVQIWYKCQIYFFCFSFFKQFVPCKSKYHFKNSSQIRWGDIQFYVFFFALKNPKLKKPNSWFSVVGNWLMRIL